MVLKYVSLTPGVAPLHNATRSLYFWRLILLGSLFKLHSFIVPISDDIRLREIESNSN
ncbi:unnamed protein product [Acanthoscelides obtectus]|uniref:Uncharacterized protein n=1 Tax=Acanthoscelides obtectus TaxID=200917 RepID=A0A9P0MGN8_ACAOB|nr:unnamed protein product [Acanthoscelides obtectus]CAH2011560.1 unnamed protein product [Acanthoscelides obtectus]CAK1627288.1 hypothetical protein AOBTE_LOCUS4485 [Acanthoscelides obtectus]CAK1627300.1 hypothetical protein AOBTE_LOCUS4496 [Acanthoscelides obtectus]